MNDAALPAHIDKYEIVARALEKDPARRYALWHEFARDLARLAALDLPRESISETEKFNALRGLPFFAHFGEMCYIRQGAIARTATVIAATPVTLLKIKANALASASERCQLAFNRAFLDILVDRLAETDAELAGLRR